ncbi:MAG: hypothetical protein ACYDAY_06035 [Candidatus Dormibacteria bacterium]
MAGGYRFAILGLTGLLAVLTPGAAGAAGGAGVMVSSSARVGLAAATDSDTGITYTWATIDPAGVRQSATVEGASLGVYNVDFALISGTSQVNLHVKCASLQNPIAYDYGDQTFGDYADVTCGDSEGFDFYRLSLSPHSGSGPGSPTSNVNYCSIAGVSAQSAVADAAVYGYDGNQFNLLASSTGGTAATVQNAEWKGSELTEVCEPE